MVVSKSFASRLISLNVVKRVERDTVLKTSFAICTYSIIWRAR